MNMSVKKKKTKIRSPSQKILYSVRRVNRKRAVAEDSRCRLKWIRIFSEDQEMNILTFGVSPTPVMARNI